MTKKYLYSSEVYQETLDRINKLTEETQPVWGKMSVGQMLRHCAETQEVMNGTKDLKNTPFIAKLFKGMIRKAVVGEKPFKKNLQTHPQYVQTTERDFEREKERLLSVLQFFVEQSETEAIHAEHPFFGKMTKEEKGWGMYKHLDHHLSQFGV